MALTPQQVEQALVGLAADNDPLRVIKAIHDLHSDLQREAAGWAMSVRHASLLNMSSFIINAGQDAREIVAVQQGERWAREALDSGSLPDRFLPMARYNIANAILAEVDIQAAPPRTNDDPLAPGRYTIAARLEHAEELREARVLLANVGHGTTVDPKQRGTALCNLANTLSASGRWVEAYEAYVDALAADPTNGNAAGNAAVCLRRAARAGLGLPGHLMAVSDKYVAVAHANRQRTVEVAGEAVARRWDEIQMSGSTGHSTHVGDADDPYRQWVAQNRLALTATVEGLGTEGPRWDSAAVRRVTTSLAESKPPPIFAMMNVIKADYLAARRLAFRGERMLNELVQGQHVDDPGMYTDTLEGDVYGEHAASLILASRATLDVLDKLAVAANDHLNVGQSPARIDFRTFWQDARTGAIRARLVPTTGPGFTALALAELAGDTQGGLYKELQELRNAGTHRMIKVTSATTTGIDKVALSNIDASHLVDATHKALRVARAAYLYLIGLIHEHEPVNTRGQQPHVVLGAQA